MARALICDACEAHATYPMGEDRPPGWITVRLARERHAPPIDACSPGCAVRALATFLHEDEKPHDERDLCIIAGCQNPAMPLRSCCPEHEPALIPES